MLLRRLLLPVLVALALAPSALASGGNYRFDGGSRAEQGQVKDALDASSFDWNVVPGPVTVHIAKGVPSQAAPNEIWLDADLLDSGRFSWGVVQHEYAHEVDFAVLTDAVRERLHAVLGGSSWWSSGGEGHAQYDCERFADELAWAYWPSADNVMRPSDGAGVAPAAFRAALAALLPAAAAAPQVRVTQSIRVRRPHRKG